MKLTLQQVMDATLALAQIIRDHRPLPLRGAYAVARMHGKLYPEYLPIEERRLALKAKHGLEGDGPHPGEPLAAFDAEWKEFTADTVDVDVQPLSLDLLDTGKPDDVSITAREMNMLGPLVTD